MALVGRKWVLILVLLFLLAVAFWIGVALLPHHVLTTMLQYEEKPNGLRNPPPKNLPAGLVLQLLAR